MTDVLTVQEDRLRRSYKDGLTPKSAALRNDETMTEYCETCHGFRGERADGSTCPDCGGYGTVIRLIPRAR